MQFNLNYESRIKGEIDYAINHILKNKVYEPQVTLSIKGAVTKEPVSYNKRLELNYKQFKIGEKWGDLFDCAWFNVTGKIDNYNPKLKYHIKLDFAGEALLYDKEGNPLKGFTNGSSSFDFNLGLPGKVYFEINELIEPNGSIDIWVEAGMNDLFGKLSNEGRIDDASIGFINEELLTLFYDLEVLFDLLKTLKRDNPFYHELLNKLQEIQILILYQNEGWAAKASEIARSLLSQKSNVDFEFIAVGHGHLDLAWLWPIRESKRKILRTITNMFYLIERYPDFIFGISQPQQLEWIKDNALETYNQIKEYVKQGRIVLQGGMWVEADTNVSGEEALVRQMLYGINYFKEEFGVRVKELWLPDVFGYNASMPQIIKKSGLDYFMTIKLSWSLVNKFPYHSFKWVGIDDSSVITHMPPEGTYNSAARPSSMLFAKENYQEKDLLPIALNVYGIGNGGGGPGVEHVERIIRQKSLREVPKVSFGDQNIFFEKLSKYEKILPSWKGELYLENHQGTYTSAMEVKRYNRLLEEKLKSIETYLALINKYDKYHDRLENIWKEVLLYQFHDILPGSSIARVYDECIPRYHIMSSELDEILKEVNKSNQKHHFNPNLLPTNLIFKEDGKYLYKEINRLSTKSKSTSYLLSKTEVKNKVETRNLLIEFDEKSGFIKSIFSKKLNREFLKSGGNVLSVYKDFGNGWDIPEHYRKQTPIHPNLVNRQISNYTRFIEITSNYEFLNSKLKEVMLIDTETNLIYFDTNLDLQDMGVMLRTAFNFDTNLDDATFDIQYGDIKRPSTNRDTIEKAQFEVAGQKWIAYEDKNLILGLVNKSKYGFYAKDGTLDIHLARSTNSPAEGLGLGKTKFSYVLYLNTDQSTSNLDIFANQYNTFYPVVDTELDFGDVIKIDNPHIELSALKQSEDKKGLILRLYNRTSKEQSINAKDIDLGEIFETNLVEEHPTKVNSKSLTFGPYEVRTFKFIK